jgi:hypothetical protein
LSGQHVSKVNRSPLPERIHGIFRELIEWAGRSYLAQLEKIGLKTDEFVAISIEEDEVQKHLAQLSSFFLSEENKSKINFLPEDRLKRSFPPPSAEHQFHWGLEHLLLWSGACLASRLDAPSVNSIIDQFWIDFGSPAKRVSYLPVLGCYTAPNGTYYEPFSLSPDAVLRNLRIHEFSHFKNEAHRLQILPGQRPILFGPLMIELSGLAAKEESHENEKGTRASLTKFRVLMRGLFGIPAMLPIVISGIKSAWSPFVYEGAAISSREISEMKLESFKKHWACIQLPDLERHNITVNRLDRSEEREAWQDVIIDLCIALESLLPSVESEMTHTYSTWIASLLGNAPAEKKQIYDFVRWIYKLRGSLVHGNTVKDLFKGVPKEEFERRREVFKNYIERAFTLILLNPEVRTRTGLTDRLLGSNVPLVNSPTAILKGNDG